MLKKSIILTAVLASFSNFAMAQAEPLQNQDKGHRLFKIYGQLEMAGEYRNASGVNGQSGVVSDLSFIGLKVGERLGKGLGLGAKLELEFNPDTGMTTTPEFKASTLSLGTKLGTFWAGRDESTYVSVNQNFDVAGTDSQGSYNAIFGRTIYSNPSSLNATDGLNAEKSNTIGWESLPWHNTRISASFSSRENIAGGHQTSAIGAEYERGPWEAALVWQKQNYSGLALSTGSNTDTGVKGSLSYDFGGHTKVFFTAEKMTQDVNRAAMAFDYSRNAYSLGANYHTGPHLIGAAYTHASKGKWSTGATLDSSAHQTSVVYNYSMSRRTQLFANASVLHNGANANYDLAKRADAALVAGSKISSFGVGLRHSF